MRTRTLTLALLIAASLAPVAGCGDNSDAAIHQRQHKNQNNNLTSEPADDSSGDQSHSGSPIPVNDPNQAARDSNPRSSNNSQNPDDPKNQAASSARSSKRYQMLRQRIQALQSAHQKQQKRLDQQAKRLSALEGQVKKLTQRLRQRSQPAAADDGPANGATETAPTPDVVSPQAPSDDQTSPSSPVAPTRSDEPDNSSGDDNDGSDAETKPADASPAADPAQGPNIVAHCPPHDLAPLYDVFFQSASQSALAAAVDQAKAAGISDRYKSPSGRRLYLGRYGTCALAARRRDDVHQRIGLALQIAAVTSPQRHHTPGSHQTPSSARTQSTRSAASQTPFHVVSLETRGTHRYLGVAPRGSDRLGDIAWLSPGAAYDGWTLRAIHADTATFANDHQTIVVALPDRG